MDEDQEMNQIRIKYRGQCPYHKGHEFEGAAFFMGLLVGFSFLIIINAAHYSIWENWALKNNYASYNKTGKIEYVKP